MSKNRAAAEAHFHEGNRHMAAGRASEAEACFREAIRLAPDFAEAYANLGMLLDDEERLDEAESSYRRSLALNADIGQTHLNLGGLLLKQKRFGEAEAAYRQAIILIPDSPAPWSNLGVLQACRKQEVAAEQSYRLAMKMDPDYRVAPFNLSYLLLRQGRFEEGWRCLEARDWYARLQEKLPCPRWRGESLRGRSLLIGFEAGHGDMIQFGRYAAVLKAKGAARIDMICHPALQTLFATLDGVDSVLSFDQPLPPWEWNFWTPPFSMPYYCQTRLDSIPAALPYLRAEGTLIEKWASVMSSLCVPSAVRVGLAWKGNPRFENDADRSLASLSIMEPLGAIAGVHFFSLQKGPGEDEAAGPPAGLPLVNLGPQISDFADSAAIIVSLDLVICVDTAIAHLAGALGKECWVLLPDYKTDWRWLTGRSDSPWYPGVMQLFRQSRVGDWKTVLDEVRVALQRFVGTCARNH
jgi:Tfp pilus assembly protein PilF